MANIRQYAIDAKSTDVFGRVMCSARNHHVVIDGPVQNGCPGEAMTPPESFLLGVAACGIELVEVIAKELGFPRPVASVEIEGTIDRDHPVRPDFTLFNKVRMRFEVR